MARVACVLALLLAAGCSGGDGEDEPAPREDRAPDVAPAVPDGGTQRGHDRGPGASLRVPERDATPPVPEVRVEPLAPEVAHVRATVTGTDEDGGMGRARVAFRARFACRDGERTWTRPYVRYFPPPMIERIRVAPGTRVETQLVRTARMAFDRARCEGGELEAVHGEAWADTTNASGLDATSDHVRFSWP